MSHVNGRLAVTVLEGKELKKEDLIKNDPYVKVKVHNKILGRGQKTQVAKAGTNPKWGDTIVFDLKDTDLTTKISFRVYDKDTLKDDKIGRADLTLNQLASHTGSEWLQLHNFHDAHKICGYILVNSKFEGSGWPTGGTGTTGTGVGHTGTTGTGVGHTGTGAPLTHTGDQYGTTTGQGDITTGTHHSLKASIPGTSEHKARKEAEHSTDTHGMEGRTVGTAAKDMVTSDTYGRSDHQAHVQSGGTGTGPSTGQYQGVTGTGVTGTGLTGPGTHTTTTTNTQI